MRSFRVHATRFMTTTVNVAAASKRELCWKSAVHPPPVHSRAVASRKREGPNTRSPRARCVTRSNFLNEGHQLHRHNFARPERRLD